MAALAYLPASVHAVPDTRAHSIGLHYKVQMSSQACWLTAQHPSPFFLSSSQVTTEEAPAVPEHIQLAGAQGKGHFCYPSARKGQLQVSFSGSPLAASSAGPAFCSPHQGLSPSHLQKKQPLLTGEWEKVPLTLLTVLLTITELNNSVCTYSWAGHQHLQELH